MPRGDRNRWGGARSRSGPVRVRYTISGPAAILLREIAKRRRLTRHPTHADLVRTLEEAIRLMADAEIETIETIVEEK